MAIDSSIKFGIQLANKDTRTLLRPTIRVLRVFCSLTPSLTKDHSPISVPTLIVRKMDETSLWTCASISHQSIGGQQNRRQRRRKIGSIFRGQNVSWHIQNAIFRSQRKIRRKCQLNLQGDGIRVDRKVHTKQKGWGSRSFAEHRDGEGKGKEEAIEKGMLVLIIILLYHS